MNGKLINQIIACLHGVISHEELLSFVLQLIAWIRLSKLGKLSGEHAFNSQDLPRSSSHISDIFDQIVAANMLGDESMAFNYVSPGIQHISAGQMLQAIELVMHIDLVEPWHTSEFVSVINERAGRLFQGVPLEVAELMVSIADIKPDSKIYIPLEQGFQLTACAQNVSHRTFSETPLASALPWLMNLLCDTTAKITIGDSIEKPGFLDEGRLTRFPVSLSFPAMGGRYNTVVSESDRFGRFPEATSSGAVLSVCNMLARTIGRIVIAVPNNVLYSRGAERAMRDGLLANKQVEAVITLPPALLFGTSIQFSLLVMRTDVQCNDILFVDANHNKFFEKDTRARATLTGWQAIVDLFKQRQGGEFTRLVPTKEVEMNDANLMVSRYCKTADDDALAYFLRQYQTVALAELVDIIRPVPLSQDGTISVLEISQADFPEYGYAIDASRTVKMSETNAKSGGKAMLAPEDIVLSNRGNVGRLAIISKNIAENTVAGQSCVILRIREKSSTKIDPHVLFTFLKSKMGQLQLRQITAGASVAVIQTRDLERLNIPIPTAERTKNIIEAFHKTNEIEKSIAVYREQQQQISEGIWV